MKKLSNGSNLKDEQYVQLGIVIVIITGVLFAMILS
jgi:hypothetical protein